MNRKLICHSDILYCLATLTAPVWSSTLYHRSIQESSYRPFNKLEDPETRLQIIMLTITTGRSIEMNIPDVKGAFKAISVEKGQPYCQYICQTCMPKHQYQFYPSSLILNPKPKILITRQVHIQSHI